MVCLNDDSTDFYDKSDLHVVLQRRPSDPQSTSNTLLISGLATIHEPAAVNVMPLLRSILAIIALLQIIYLSRQRLGG
jgi:hypothetical protein